MRAFATLFVFTLAASAQNPVPGTPATQQQPDPSLDTTDMPFYVKLLPKPTAEPWAYPDGDTRWRRFAKETFGPMTYGSAAFAAAYSFWLNNPREWDQDLTGYGQRLGNNVAGAWVRGSMVHGLAAAFKEDISYSRSNKSTAKERLIYALSRSMVAKNENGDLRFSYSRAMGGVGSAFVSRTWVPESWRPWDNAMKNYGYWVATEAGFNVAKEFVPSLIRVFQRKKANQK